MNIDTSPWRFHVGNHKQVGVEYLAEIRELIRVVERPDFDNLLAHFAAYSDYLAGQSRDHAAKRSLIEAAPDKRIFDITNKQPQVLKAFAMAQLAACCHLLHGSKVTRQQFSGEHSRVDGRSVCQRALIQTCRISKTHHRQDSYHGRHPYHAAAASPWPGDQAVSEFHQLGIGTAEGTRDVLGLHLMPSIRQVSGGDGTLLELSTEQQLLTDIIIADPNPVYRNGFEELNSDPSNNITAYNQDALMVLDDLKSTMETRRNLVTALRIDHRMIPDLNGFLAQLGQCVTDDCDLILSIGAGDTREDFEGRIKVVESLNSALNDAGMRPVLFKFHESGDLDRQWNTLRYGNRRASTYQLIYCRVDGSILVGRSRDRQLSKVMQICLG